MSQGMLGNIPLADLQGPRDDFETKLASADGQAWLEEFKKFLQKKPCWSPQVQTTQVVKPKPSILEFVSIVKIPATTVPFVAKEKFVVNTAEDAPVKISYIGGNSKEWFLDGDGKTEGPIGEQTLSFAKLRKASVDAPIIAELGGEEKSETTLSEMFSLMQVQGSGETGVLLNNGHANIFYTKDCAGVLRAVSVFWGGGGWGVLADSVLRADGWGDGRQVFSRNSVVLESSETLVSAQA